MKWIVKGGWLVQWVCREAVVELFVDVPLDGGDLFLLGGLEAKSCSEWFELEGGFVHLLGEGGLELSELGT